MPHDRPRPWKSIAADGCGIEDATGEKFAEAWMDGDAELICRLANERDKLLAACKPLVPALERAGFFQTSLDLCVLIQECEADSVS